jgi:fucose permease
MILLAMCGMFFVDTKALLYLCIALVGFGNSNIFSIIFSQALLSEPDRQNEVSGLMIMGLFGGTIFPLAMGYASDMIGQAGSVAVMTIGAIYLVVYTMMIKKSK